MAPRRKPTKAQQKQKAAKGKKVAVQQPGAAPAPVQNPPFAAIRKHAGEKQIVLHIGCGAPNPEKLHISFRGDDWFELRLDVNPAAQPHIVADIRDLSMIPENAVDAVWASHNLEHLFPHHLPLAFREIYRVIKPGGHFLATMPDVQTVATYVAHGQLMEPIYDAPGGSVAPIDILYGFRRSLESGNPFMAHHTAFTAKSLSVYLRDAGFTNLRLTRKWVDLWAVGYKYAPGDPRISDRTQIFVDQQNQQMKLPDPLPVNRTPHPGQFAPRILSDELDIPPKEWHPLGLKKSG